MSQVSAKRNWFHIGLFTDELGGEVGEVSEVSSERLDLQFVCSDFWKSVDHWGAAEQDLDAFRTSPGSVRLRWGVPSCRTFYVFPITWMCCSWFDHLQNRAVTSWASPVNTNSWKGSLFQGSPHHLGRSPGVKERGGGEGPAAHHAVTLLWEARGPSQDTQQYSPAHRTRWYLCFCYPEKEAQSKLHGSITVTVVKS